LATTLMRVGFAGSAVAFSVKNCLFNVDGGEQAVMFNRFAGGVSDKIYGEGSHFMIPWFQYPTIFSIRTKPKDIQTETATKDMQTVNLTLRLLYKPNFEKLPLIFKSLGVNFDDRVLPSVGYEVMKSVIAQYDAEQLLTRREEVSREIRTQITDRCMAYDILLDDVSMTHVAFGTDFNKAVEDKQVAEQEAMRQQFVVAITEQEKLATVVRAEGEAEAAELVSSSLEKHGSDTISVKRIKTAKEIAVTLSKASNVMYLPGGGAGGPQMLLSVGK